LPEAHEILIMKQEVEDESTGEMSPTVGGECGARGNVAAEEDIGKKAVSGK